jgi:RNA polymerase sigma-70 factor (ECF subfamily)
MTKGQPESLEGLVDRARAGDRQAFSGIVRQLMSQVAALTYRMTGDRDSALDLAQDTFVSAWENLRTFRGDAGFANWLYRIATNKSLNHLKARSRREPTDDLPDQIADSRAPDPHRQIEQRELAERVLQFMHSLPPQQRVIFELRFYQGRSFEEIARATERALGTVKTGYREAVKKLRVFAEEKGYR